jgi:hypothetical protein
MTKIQENAFTLILSICFYNYCLFINYHLNQNRHSGESRNPVLSRPSGCRIKSGMTKKAVYGQTLIRSLVIGNYLELGIRCLVISFNW